MSGRVTLHNVAMPPACTHSPTTKPSITAPGWTGDFTIALTPDQEPNSEPWRQALGADALRRRLDVVRHAAIGDLARPRVVGHERGRWFVVAGVVFCSGFCRFLLVFFFFF